MPIVPGARVWPYGVNRGEIVSVERAYQSQIWLSTSGKEKRRALRDRPRKRLSFSTKGSRDCFRQIMRELHGHQPKTYALPDWTRRVVSTSTMLAGGDRIDVASVEEWMIVDETVILSATGRVEVRTIDSILGSTLVFDEVNGPDAWPVGTRVYAGLQGHWQARQAGERPLRNVIRISAEFDVDPVSEPYIEPPAAAVQFNGRDVFNLGPARISPPRHDVLSGLEAVDYGVSTVAHYQNVTYPTEIYELSYVGCDPATVKRLEDFFVRARGQVGEFYMPSWENDLVPAVTAGAGTNTLDVVGEDVAASYLNSTVFKCLAVRFKDNTQEYNIVTGLAAGAGISTLTLQNNWARAIDASQIRGISWMPVCRFASDTLVTEWTIKQVARMRMAIRTLEDLPGN